MSEDEVVEHLAFLVKSFTEGRQPYEAEQMVPIGLSLHFSGLSLKFITAVLSNGLKSLTRMSVSLWRATIAVI